MPTINTYNEVHDLATKKYWVHGAALPLLPPLTTGTEGALDVKRAHKTKV